MMDNYEFCFDFLSTRLPPGGRVLDYGCGAGRLVRLCRQSGLDAYGCDRFYGGCDTSVQIPQAWFERGIVRRMKGHLIPFAARSFDLVVSNQVLEHVEDLDQAIGEFGRVLKDGGAVLSLFPDRRVWREGHSGLPFLHWFPKDSHLRLGYALALRTLGLGRSLAGHYDKHGSSRLEWSRNVCRWLDSWTCYRSLGQIDRAFGARFSRIRHIEAHWFDRRLEGKPVAGVLPRGVKVFIARKFAHLVLIADNPPEQPGGGIKRGHHPSGGGLRVTSR
jgi:SAM-dependent methyltransferase